ncbi:hypothetical protein D3C81_527400 [compost metagenome]
MNIEWKIDWTAVAALIALFIWVADKIQRSGERSATRRLLAQIMTSPIGNARLEVVKIRARLAEDGAKQLLLLAESSELRIAFWDHVKALVVDLPPQFYDKADIFSRSTTGVLAAALSAVNELRSIVRMTSELASTTADDEVYNHIRTVGEKTVAADDALKCAFEELIRVGKKG